MQIWYVSLFEPLPIDGENVRKMRSGWICDALMRENNVELWIPGFDHLNHNHYKKESVDEKLKSGLNIQYLKGIGYKKDTSFKRLFHNKYIAKEFKKIANQRTLMPDLIITQIPCLELAEEVIKFAEKNKIPSIVDIRDLWPDIYKKILPRKIKWIYKFLFFREINRLKFILQKSSEICAISKSYLKWGEKYSKRSIETKNIFYIGYKKPEIINDKKIWESLLIEKNIPCEKKYIIFSGTFCESYDLSPITKAAMILKDKGYEDFHFLIAGAGNLPKNILEELKNSSEISLLGWLNKKELNCCLINSDAGLAPYSKDALMSLPNKFFEYLAYGLPIISSLNSEMEVLINQRKLGFNYYSQSPESLASAIIELNKNFKNKLSRNSILKEFEDNFDGDKIYFEFAKFVKRTFNTNSKSLFNNNL